MKLGSLNLGKSLSKEEQKKIKGGTPYCNAGQYAYCACSSGNTCIVTQGNGVSLGSECQSYCHAGPVLGYYQCYDSCPSSPEA